MLLAKLVLARHHPQWLNKLSNFEKQNRCPREPFAPALWCPTALPSHGVSIISFEFPLHLHSFALCPVALSLSKTNWISNGFHPRSERAAGHQRKRMQKQWEPKGNNGHTMGGKSHTRATRHKRKGMQMQWEPNGNNGQPMGRKSSGAPKKQNANAMGTQRTYWTHHGKDKQ